MDVQKTYTRSLAAAVGKNFSRLSQQSNESPLLGGDGFVLLTGVFNGPMITNRIGRPNALRSF